MITHMQRYIGTDDPDAVVLSGNDVDFIVHMIHGFVEHLKYQVGILASEKARLLHTHRHDPGRIPGALRPYLTLFENFPDQIHQARWLQIRIKQSAEVEPTPSDRVAEEEISQIPDAWVSPRVSPHNTNAFTPRVIFPDGRVWVQNPIRSWIPLEEETVPYATSRTQAEEAALEFARSLVATRHP